MNRIDILDCTLRDGGYCNDWRFASDTFERIVRHLILSNVDLIEVGLISESGRKSNNNTKYLDASICNNMLSKAFNNPNYKNQFVCLINHNDYDVKMLPMAEQCSFGGIRYTFHRGDLNEVEECIKIILERGYQVYVQPMYTSNYSVDELGILMDIANKNRIKAMYIVDSFGSLRADAFLSMLMFYERSLPKNVSIGFHSHNNLKQAFSLSSKMILMNMKHDVIIDACLGGMGRGAGNLSLACICDFYNSEIKNKYDLEQIKNMEKKVINEYYENAPWGSDPYLTLSALYNAHPNYAMLCREIDIDVMKAELFFQNMDNIKKEVFDMEYANTILKTMN